MNPKISIITATFNSLTTLRTTVDSMLQQTYDNIEHIIIDGGSTDGTVEWLKNNNDKFSFWISEKDKGIYDALNKGISLSNGEIIGFLHADDFYADKNILLNIANRFSEEKCHLLYGDLEYISAKEENKIIRYWKSGQFETKKLKYGWMPPHPTVYFVKAITDQFGVFDLAYKISADYEWILRVLTNDITVSYLPEVMIKMRIGGTSNNGIKNIIQKSKEDFKAIKKHGFNPYLALFLKNFSKINQFFIRSKK